LRKKRTSDASKFRKSPPQTSAKTNQTSSQNKTSSPLSKSKAKKPKFLKSYSEELIESYEKAQVKRDAFSKKELPDSAYYFLLGLTETEGPSTKSLSELSTLLKKKKGRSVDTWQLKLSGSKIRGAFEKAEEKII